MSEPARDLHPALADDDQRIFLRGVSWAQYEMIQQIRGERRFPRLTYLEGALTLMSPGRNHERIATMIDVLLRFWAVEARALVYGYRSWTLKREDQQRGAEADNCYTVGEGDAEKEVADLAVEVVWSHDDPDKLAVYAGLGVREVWVWKASRITVYVLRGDAYVTAPRSELLPALDLALLARFADRLDQPQALREYRDALRDPT
ncbi:MAG: Uma2 family endonuclease [Polyangiales bacterium]